LLDGNGVDVFAMILFVFVMLSAPASLIMLDVVAVLRVVSV
jgi:hypothetical protein